MKIEQVAGAIARREGHASKARIAEIAAVLGILSDISYTSAESIHAIVQLGIARRKKKRKRHRIATNAPTLISFSPT